MRKHAFASLLTAAMLCWLPSAWAFHTIPCSNLTIQGAIDAIAAEEKANGGPDGVDFYIALGGGLVFNEPIVINDNGTPGGVVIAIIGGLAIDSTDPNRCAASPGVFDGSQTTISGGGRFHQSVIQVTGHATVYLDALALTGANLSGSGGGISFDGTGSLNLYGVHIANNTAGSGAGIHANGSTPGLGLNFHDLVLPTGAHIINFIQGNRATNGSGGGMDLSGETSTVAIDGTLVVSQNTASGNGGAMAFGGSGSVQLGNNVHISGNAADNGGGLYADSNAGVFSSVYFYDGVVIDGNKAMHDGGGVSLSNKVDLHADAVSQPTLIVSNQALSSSARGGGMFVRGPAVVSSFSGSITDNSAAYGGGMAVVCPTGNDDADVRLNGRAGAPPATIARNSATFSGGGVYADSGDATTCVFRASNFTFEANNALDGSVLFGKSSGNIVSFLLNGGDACRSKPKCNAIVGNYQGNGTANGSTLVLPQNSTLQAVRVKIQGNQAAHLLRAADNNSYASILIGLITGNQTGNQLIDAGPATLSIQDTTFADNMILDGSTLIRARNVFFYNNIVSEQEPDTFDFAGNADGGHNIADVLTNGLDNTMIHADGLVLYGRPGFVDAANGDYHLAPYSLGIDVGAADPQVPIDLDQNPRDIDEALIDNVDGPRDLGAYEFNGVLTPRFCSASDEIFCGRFE